MANCDPETNNGTEANNEEVMIEQLAELRASTAVLTLMVFAIMESRGEDVEKVTKDTTRMQVDLANRIENDCRRRRGLGPRIEPRKSIVMRLDREIDWSSMGLN